jgi:hypothetical protein
VAFNGSWFIAESTRSHECPLLIIFILPRHHLDIIQSRPFNMSVLADPVDISLSLKVKDEPPSPDGDFRCGICHKSYSRSMFISIFHLQSPECSPQRGLCRDLRYNGLTIYRRPPRPTPAALHQNSWARADVQAQVLRNMCTEESPLLDDSSGLRPLYPDRDAMPLSPDFRARQPCSSGSSSCGREE